MITTSAPSQRHPVEQLAEDFVTRFRHGERPSLSEYVHQFPDVAGELADIIEALLALEDLGTFGEQLASAPPLPERLGEYRILREIGRGGMGVVYAAEQPELGRHVALKVLPTAALLRPTHLERFRREARAAARLHHTNIIPIYGVGVHDGIHFYAMQYIAGRGLDAIIDDLRRHRAAPTDETAKAVATLHSHSGSTGSTEFYRVVARVSLQIAEAVAHAHEHAVLHRDIKPANVLLDVDGTAWLGDFGLAYLEGDAPLTSTGGFVGTLRYLAPERFQGEGDARSDVYSLGATIYELLTLRPMFEETDRARLLQQVAQEEPPPPRRIERSVPRDLETIVLKAIAKDPTDRYATAQALADDLHRYLHDRPIAARRATRWEMLSRWVRRNPLTAGLLTSVLLSLSGGLAATWWQWRRAEANLADKVAALSEAQHFAQQADEQSARATAHGHRAHEMLTGLLKELNIASERQFVGDLRKRLIEKALNVHEEFIKATPIDTGERLDIVKLGHEVADLHRRLKQYPLSEKYLERALALVEPEASEATGQLEFRYLKARLLGVRGMNLREQTRYEQAHEELEKSIVIYRGLCASEPTNRLYARGLGGALHNRGVTAADLGQTAQAISFMREGITVIEPFLNSDPDDGNLKIVIARSYQTLANQYMRMQQYDEARNVVAQALRLADELERANPRSAIFQDLVGRCTDLDGRVRVGEAMAIQDDDPKTAHRLYQEAEAPLRRAQTARRRLVEYNRADADYHNYYADTLCILATAFIGLDRTADAEKLLQQAIQERSEALRLSPKIPSYIRGQATNYFMLGRSYCATGDYAKAAKLAPNIAALPAQAGMPHTWIADLYCQCGQAARRDAKLAPDEQVRATERFQQQALDELRQAVKKGYANREVLATSIWLRPLRGQPEFQKILDALPAKQPIDPPIND